VRFLAALLVSTAALAQTPTNASLSYEALAKAPAGAWAQYQMVGGPTNGTTMRYALVEKGAKTMALEIETTAPPIVMRMDFAANGAAWKLTRIRMKLAGGEVREVPPPEGAADIIKKAANFGKPLGSETLKTAAGSFACKHYRQQTTQGEAEVWMSDKALPSGLVKTTLPSLGATITLTATGTGAMAKIR
jgi:hypothetical protein